MRVTEVQITPVKANNGLVAIASVIFDDALFLGSIGVYTRLDGTGYRLTYPTKNQGGKSFNVYHPINSETSKTIECAVLEKVTALFDYQNKRSNDHVRHCSTHDPKRIL